MSATHFSGSRMLSWGQELNKRFIRISSHDSLSPFGSNCTPKGEVGRKPESTEAGDWPCPDLPLSPIWTPELSRDHDLKRLGGAIYRGEPRVGRLIPKTESLRGLVVDNRSRERIVAQRGILRALGRLLAIATLSLASCEDTPDARSGLARIVDLAGDTELHLAAYLGQTAAVRRLLCLGAPIEARNESGETPLHLAVDKGQKEVVEVLLAAGADVNAKTACQNPSTPLDYALDDAIRSLLLKAGGLSVHTDHRTSP